MRKQLWCLAYAISIAKYHNCFRIVTNGNQANNAKPVRCLAIAIARAKHHNCFRIVTRGNQAKHATHLWCHALAIKIAKHHNCSRIVIRGNNATTEKQVLWCLVTSVDALSIKRKHATTTQLNTKIYLYYICLNIRTHAYIIADISVYTFIYLNICMSIFVHAYQHMYNHSYIFIC